MVYHKYDIDRKTGEVTHTQREAELQDLTIHGQLQALKHREQDELKAAIRKYGKEVDGGFEVHFERASRMPRVRVRSMVCEFWYSGDGGQIEKVNGVLSKRGPYSCSSADCRRNIMVVAPIVMMSESPSRACSFGRRKRSM